MTTTTPEIDPDDTTAPALPVTGDKLELIDGARVVVLSRRHATNPGRDTWTVKGPDGRRIIRRSQIARFLNDGADEATDVDHAAALVLNAALDWERACERGSGDLATPADELHKAIRAWAALVAE